MSKRSTRKMKNKIKREKMLERMHTARLTYPISDMSDPTNRSKARPPNVIPSMWDLKRSYEGSTTSETLSSDSSKPKVVGKMSSTELQAEKAKDSKRKRDYFDEVKRKFARIDKKNRKEEKQKLLGGSKT